MSDFIITIVITLAPIIAISLSLHTIYKLTAMPPKMIRKRYRKVWRPVHKLDPRDHN